jgi:hypothetical protein
MTCHSAFNKNGNIFQMAFIFFPYVNLMMHKNIVYLRIIETWSLTLKKEQRLRDFENRVLRKMFGLRRDEVTGEWRKVHNEEFRDLNSSSIIRIIKSKHKWGIILELILKRWDGVVWSRLVWLRLGTGEHL